MRQLSLNAGRPRQPLEDYDPNSQDSGYGHSEDSKSTCSSSDFCFAQPNGYAPRRSAAESPRRSLMSSSSNESNDDGFLDFISPVSKILDYFDYVLGFSNALIYFDGNEFINMFKKIFTRIHKVVLLCLT